MRFAAGRRVQSEFQKGLTNKAFRRERAAPLFIRSRVFQRRVATGIAPLTGSVPALALHRE